MTCHAAGLVTKRGRNVTSTFFNLAFSAVCEIAKPKANAIPQEPAKPKITEAAQKWHKKTVKNEKNRFFIPEGFPKNAALIKPYGFTYTCNFRKRLCLKALLQQGPKVD